jgi:hypothetical protein
VPRSAAVCNLPRYKFPWVMLASIFRSKFNVALGVESQGFCILK